MRSFAVWIARLAVVAALSGVAAAQHGTSVAFQRAELQGADSASTITVFFEISGALYVSDRIVAL